MTRGNNLYHGPVGSKVEVEKISIMDFFTSSTKKKMHAHVFGPCMRRVENSPNACGSASPASWTCETQGNRVSKNRDSLSSDVDVLRQNTISSYDKPFVKFHACITIITLTLLFPF